MKSRPRIVLFKARQPAQRWRELRAVEVQFAAAGRDAFGGEDPELPPVREDLKAAREMYEQAVLEES